MKVIRYLYLPLIFAVISCSDPKNSTTASETSQNTIAPTPEKNLLYLGFWEGMNKSEQKQQLDLEIKNGNLPSSKQALSEYDYDSFNFNLFVDDKNIRFEMKFHYDTTKLSYISLQAFDHNISPEPNSVKYILSNKAFNRLLSFYKTKYGNYKTKNFYYDIADHFLDDVKGIPTKEVIKKFNQLYIWELEGKIVVIEQRFWDEKSGDEVQISYYPKDYNYLAPFLKYYQTSDSTTKPKNKITKSNI